MSSSPADKTTDPADLRRSYSLAGLCRRDLPSDPLELFQRWFNEALAADILEPNAMVLSTCLDGQPCSRTKIAGTPVKLPSPCRVSKSSLTG